MSNLQKLMIRLGVCLGGFLGYFATMYAMIWLVRAFEVPPLRVVLVLAGIVLTIGFPFLLLMVAIGKADRIIFGIPASHNRSA